MLIKWSLFQRCKAGLISKNQSIKLKKKYHMIVSTVMEKALDTIRNPLMIYVLRKPVIEESFLNLVNNTQIGPPPPAGWEQGEEIHSHWHYSTQLYEF